MTINTIEEANAKLDELAASITTEEQIIDFIVDSSASLENSAAQLVKEATEKGNHRKMLPTEKLLLGAIHAQATNLVFLRQVFSLMCPEDGEPELTPNEFAMRLVEMMRLQPVVVKPEPEPEPEEKKNDYSH